MLTRWRHTRYTPEGEMLLLRRKRSKSHRARWWDAAGRRLRMAVFLSDVGNRSDTHFLHGPWALLVHPPLLEFGTYRQFCWAVLIIDIWRCFFNQILILNSRSAHILRWRWYIIYHPPFMEFVVKFCCRRPHYRGRTPKGQTPASYNVMMDHSK